METASQYVTQLWSRLWLDFVLQSPILLIAIIGFFWSLIKIRRYPSAAKRAMLACTLLIVQSLVFAGGYAWLLGKMGEWQWSVDRLAQTVKWLDGGRSLLVALALLLLLMAAFGQREPVAVETKKPTTTF